ncbi:MAG: glycosyltransferase family 2 protein, partial [Hyphomicrobiales bacterium]|nr:glycosyltransferase family 2 protein [Hyphomicrobiales bacterium]
MPAPRVSVVIPTRNRAFCLGEAIDSIRAQTFQDWELIVVDDGSEDETGDLVRRYCEQDSRIRYVRQPHGGQARSQNTALRLVRGDYFFKMDDDDVAQPDLLATCAAGLDAHPDHWAAHFPFSVYTGNREKGWTFSETTRFEPLFFRVAALRTLKGWNELYMLFEDSDLHIRAAVGRGWPIWHCEKPLYEYRRSDKTNFSHRVDALATFGHRYMFHRNEELVRWGLLGRMLGAQTLREAVARLCAAHRRNGFLPSARFAYWQEQALEEIRKE